MIDTYPDHERIVITAPEGMELKQMVLDDAPTYFALIEANREHLSQHGDRTSEKYPTLESVEEGIKNPDGEQYRFGVWAGGRMVGFMKLRRNEEGDLETGSWISADQTNRGYARKARNAILGFAFSDLGADKVVSKITVGNDFSRRSVEASGYTFVEERDGQWVYAITRDRFENGS